MRPFPLMSVVYAKTMNLDKEDMMHSDKKLGLTFVFRTYSAL